MRRVRILFAVLLAAGLVAGCATATPDPGAQVSPLEETVARSAVATPTRPPIAAATSTSTPAPTVAPTAAPSPTAQPAVAALALAVLHTNDNWGETEPCG